MKKFTGLIVFSMALVLMAGMAFAKAQKAETQKTDIAVTLNDHIAVPGSVVPGQAIVQRNPTEAKANEVGVISGTFIAAINAEARNKTNISITGMVGSAVLKKPILGQKVSSDNEMVMAEIVPSSLSGTSSMTSDVMRPAVAKERIGSADSGGAAVVAENKVGLTVTPSPQYYGAMAAKDEKITRTVFA